MSDMTTLPRRSAIDMARALRARHSVWIVTAGILRLGLLADLGQGLSSAVFVVDALVTTAPFLILSIAAAAYAGASGADNVIARAFTGSPLMMIAFAAALGGKKP